MTTLCTSVLSDMGVLGSIDVQEFQLGLIPLEKDLLSLEYDDVYRKLYLVSRLLVVFSSLRRLTHGSARDRMATTRPSTTSARRL